MRDTQTKAHGRGLFAKSAGPLLMAAAGHVWGA